MKLCEVTKPFQCTLGVTPSVFLRKKRVLASHLSKTNPKIADSTTHFFLHTPRSIPWLRDRQKKVVLVSFKTVIDADGQLQSEPEQPVIGSDEGTFSPVVRKQKLVRKKRKRFSNYKGRGGVRRNSMNKCLPQANSNIQCGNRKLNHENQQQKLGNRSVGNIECSPSSSGGISKKYAIAEESTHIPSEQQVLHITTPQQTSVRVLLKRITSNNPNDAQKSEQLPAATVGAKAFSSFRVKEEIKDDEHVRVHKNARSNDTNLATVAIEYFQNAQRMVQLRAQLQQSDSRKALYTNEVETTQQEIRMLKNRMVNIDIECNNLEKAFQKECNSLNKVKIEIENVRSKQCKLLLHNSQLSASQELQSNSMTVDNVGENESDYGLGGVVVKTEPPS